MLACMRLALCAHIIRNAFCCHKLCQRSSCFLLQIFVHVLFQPVLYIKVQKFSFVPIIWSFLLNLFCPQYLLLSQTDECCLGCVLCTLNHLHFILYFLCVPCFWCKVNVLFVLYRLFLQSRHVNLYTPAVSYLLVVDVVWSKFFL
jgi:hypothetical protein